ncbi:hypothetical protein MNBD_GAMMA22-2394 [hydrothermal vent metagenome]|uniref:TonB C-terminal domain-containing protein n=1 Tax=hydrothermal vent metagenome TaxID=652676 RepID=A0A3B0ZXS7_9ZZZZ
MKKILLLVIIQFFITACANQSSHLADNECANVEPRSSECIQLVFSKNESKILTLYDKELNHEPGLRGRVVFNIHLDSNGNVNQVFVTENESNSVHFANKLADVIKQFKFYEGVEYSFSYPLELAP